MEEAEIAAPVARIPVQREWVLARHVVVFCHKAIILPYEFACHDRGRARSEYEHIHEARRGVRRGWPDVEIAWLGGRTFRCELKRPGAKPHSSKDADQLSLLKRLNELGHPATWANSILSFATAAYAAGVPLAASWRTMAQLQDEYVAAETRKEEVKAAAKVRGHFASSKRAGKRATPAQVARYRAAGHLV